MHRDAFDARIVQEVRSGKTAYGDGIIDSQKDVGGWPALRTKAAPADGDHDGMPDTWEKSHGLNPDANDAGGKTMNQSYTNVEVYLNELVAY